MKILNNIKYEDVIEYKLVTKVKGRCIAIESFNIKLKNDAELNINKAVLVPMSFLAFLKEMSEDNFNIIRKTILEEKYVQTLISSK